LRLTLIFLVLGLGMGAGQTTVVTGGPNSYTTNAVDASDPALATWRSAVRNARTQVVRVALIGDSITAGLGTTGPAVRNSWAGILAQNLHSAYGNHGSGLLPLDLASGLWTSTGTWTGNTSLGPVQTSGQTTFSTVFGSVNGGDLWDLGAYYGDNADVYTMRASDSGGCNVQIDGSYVGTTSTVTSGTPVVSKASYATTLGYHTLRVIATGTGTCYVYGADWTIGSTGVSVDNVAKSGATSRAYGAAPTTENAFLTAAGAPSLVIISLGVNDWHSSTYGITLAEYTANLQALITFVKAMSSPSPSIVLLDQHETDCLSADGFACNSTLIPNWSQMRAAQQALATANGAAFVSISSNWGTYAQGNTAGWISADHVHPSTLGHAFYESVVENRIGLQPALNTLTGDLNLGSQATGMSDFLNPSTAFGYIPGVAHTLFGVHAGYKLNNGSSGNSAFGNNAGLNITTGIGNTAIGQGACGNSSITMTGNYNVCVGQGANIGATTASSVQLSSGTNANGGTLQFAAWNLADFNGNIYTNLQRLKVGSAIASAATIAPVSPITHITGTAAIATITNPGTGMAVNGYGTFNGCLTLIPDGVFTTTTAGNIALASTAVVGRAMQMCYDSATSKWYPSY
jgi:lysophospholipase L1-like esterase